MKTGVLIAVLCFGAINLLAQPNNSPAKSESNSTGNSKATPTPEHGGKSAKDAESTKGSSPNGYASSEWMLVYIAALTGLAIAYQAREMAKTTEIIGKQAELMKHQTDILVEYNKATREAADAAAKSAAATERSVGLLEKQANLMDGQLAQMKLAGEQINQQIALSQQNVDYIANTERAWVMGELGWYEKVGPNIEESTIRGGESTKVMMKLTCKNEGKSPAWIDNVYTRLDVTSGGSLVDEIDRENLGSNGRWGALSAGESRSQSVGFLAYSIRGQKDFLSAFVVIEYRDIFDIKRETFLSYAIDAHGNVYRQDGLPNRNRNT